MEVEETQLHKTAGQFDEIIRECLNLFSKKMKDYGTAWRILRTTSITDQIYIKAQRIRTIQEKGVQRIEEGQYSEFIGIINYSIMALIQLELGVAKDGDEMEATRVESYFETKANTAKQLMMDKNHDYGEAWRDMRVSSMTDLILVKLLRVKQIEDNDGQTLVSEGLEANYLDMINYAVFALIQLKEKK